MFKKLITRLVLGYLRMLAKLQLKKNSRAVVIGITGSAGKTSTRHALSMILREKGRVKESVKANSETGIPLNILGLTPKSYSALDWLRMCLLAPLMLLVNWRRFDYYVVEMGIDSPNPPKNMAYLLTILEPDLCIVLNAGLVHGDAFDHLVKDRHPARRASKIQFEIAREKMRLAHAIPPQGSIVLNWDQSEFRKLAKGINARLIKYGRLQGSTFKYQQAKVSKSGFQFSFSYQGQSHTLELADPLEPAFASTFSAAIAAAAALGVPPKHSLKALVNYRPPAGRSRLFRGINDSLILDSSYNASPATMLSSLKLLDSLAGKSKRVAVVGDMRELGRESKLAHKDLADYLQKYSDQAILFGKEVKEHAYPVLKSAKFPVKHFTSMAKLVSYLQEHLPHRSLVLVKGSQNTIFLERAVEGLIADPADITKLCRRGKYWDRQRAITS